MTDELTTKIDRLHSCFDCHDFKCSMNGDKISSIGGKLTRAQIHKVLECNALRTGNHFIQQQKLYKERLEIEEAGKKLCNRIWSARRKEKVKEQPKATGKWVPNSKFEDEVKEALKKKKVK